MPTFTEDHFFSKNIPDWERLFTPPFWRADQPRTVVEIGSTEGASAMWIVQNLLRHPESRLYCIDVWEREEQLRRFQANIAELPNASAVIPVKGRSEPALMQLRGQGVRADFVYVDGSHAAPDVLTDLVLSFGMLKRGGVIICDDYLWEDEARDGGDVLKRPKMAIDAFTTIFSRRIHMPGGFAARQSIIQKK